MKTFSPGSEPFKGMLCTPERLVERAVLSPQCWFWCSSRSKIGCPPSFFLRRQSKFSWGANLGAGVIPCTCLLPPILTCKRTFLFQARTQYFVYSNSQCLLAPIGAFYVKALRALMQLMSLDSL